MSDLDFFQNGENYALNYFDTFLDNIMDETKRVKPIKTGFDKLDMFLGGGLFPELYALGAISSLGKTSIILQIGDYIAQHGTDVILFSLEMGTDELIARSISREIFNRGIETRDKEVAGVGTREVLNGNLKSVWALFEHAKEVYKQIGQKLIIHEGNFETGIGEVRSIVDKHIKSTGKKPVVIIDYLQMLKGEEELSDKQNTDFTVSELKRMSRDFKTPIVAISSVNRASYLTPVSFESFKESGGIEYGADVLIGLELSVLKTLELGEIKKKIIENRKIVDREKALNPRKIDLVILKNRNGEPNTSIRYEFYPKNNYFREL